MRALSWECFPRAGPPRCVDPRVSPEPAYADSGFNQVLYVNTSTFRSQLPPLGTQGAWWEVDPDGQSVDSADSSCLGKYVTCEYCVCCGVENKKFTAKTESLEPSSCRTHAVTCGWIGRPGLAVDSRVRTTGQGLLTHPSVWKPEAQTGAIRPTCSAPLARSPSICGWPARGGMVWQPRHSSWPHPGRPSGYRPFLREGLSCQVFLPRH